MVHQSSSLHGRSRSNSSNSESNNSKQRKRKRRLDAGSSQSSDSDEESEKDVDKDENAEPVIPTSGLLTKAQMQEQSRLEREKQAKKLQKVNKSHQ